MLKSIRLLRSFWGDFSRYAQKFFSTSIGSAKPARNLQIRCLCNEQTFAFMLFKEGSLLLTCFLIAVSLFCQKALCLSSHKAAFPSWF